LKRIVARSLRRALRSVSFFRTLFAVTLSLVVTIGPLGSNPAVAQGTATVSGVAVDTNGNPIAGVSITLVGRRTYTATTGDDGRYTIEGVEPGSYAAVATKSGYGTQRDSSFTITADQINPLNVTLAQETLTTLREIGRTSTRSRQLGFNTSPASVNIISHQQFVDEGFQQVARALDQTPGILSSHPGTSATFASPGAITVPNIRGGLSFETASLIDGHPLAVGNFGDYVTTFLNSNVLQDVEVVKGPGAASPQTNYAINGTVNFRTLDVPLGPPRGSASVGVDRFGGVFSNYYAGGTVFNGKLGFVLDYAVDGTPGPLQNSINFITAPLGGGTINGVTLPSPNINAPTALFPNVQNLPAYFASPIVACCLAVSQTFSNKTELAKLRLNFSDSTFFTASYLGSQTWTEQNGNHVYAYNTVFTPFSGVGYSGSISPGALVNTWQNVFLPGGEWEINNEPIFQGELHTTFRNDTILARYYTASINRLQYNALGSPAQSFTQSFTSIYGTVCPSGQTFTAATGLCTGGGLPAQPPQVFNGGPGTVVYPGQSPSAGPCGTTTAPCYATGSYFRAAEEDKLHGATFEYDHPFGASGNALTFSYDEVHANTAAYAFAGDTNPADTSVPAGSHEVFRTYLLRGIFNLGKLNVTEANYLNLYDFTFGYMTVNGVQQAPGVGGFNRTGYSHFDERLGLVYRPNVNLAIRGSVGSSIAPPFLNLLDRATTAPTYNALQGGATNTLSAVNLRPETAFGYDLGADWRLGSGIDVASADLYLTNVFNQFAQPVFVSGTCTTASATPANGAPCTPGGSGAGGPFNIYTTTYANFGRSTYAGVEFSFVHDPPLGFGATLQGALIRAYPDAPNPLFYCANPPSCTVTTNIAVVPGVNFAGSFTTTGSGAINSLNGSANTAIPYAQGYAEARWRTAKDGLGLLGLTYYGKNNSFGVPAFFVVNAAVRFPIGSSKTTLQLSADNLFNVLPNAYTSPYFGVPFNLINTKVGLPNANALGPTTVRLSLTQYVGPR